MFTGHTQTHSRKWQNAIKKNARARGVPPI